MQLLLFDEWFGEYIYLPKDEHITQQPPEEQEEENLPWWKKGQYS